MQLFVNDRFLLTAQRLKSIVFAPEMGAVAPQVGVPPSDLRITFTVVDEEDRAVDIERIPPRDIRSFAHLRFPLSYIELADKFSPGSYVVQAARAGQLIGQKHVVILGTQQYTALADMVSGEQIAGPETPLTNSAAVVQAWLQSWRELYSYLDVVIPQHVIAAPPLAQNPLRLSQTTTQRLTSEAFRWVSFHINRFVFDQLFYGGVVRLQQGPNDAQFQIRLVLEYRVPPPDGREREHIEALSQILKDPRFGIDIAWARVPSAAQGPATANLDVTWRWL